MEPQLAILAGLAGITAHGDVFRDFDGLVGACEKNAELLPGVEPLKDEVKTLATEAKALKIEQENLEGARKVVTQRLNKTLADAKEASRKLRAFVLMRLGTKDEHLTQFGIIPIRRRPRRAKPPTETPAPAEGKAQKQPAPLSPPTESKPQ